MQTFTAPINTTYKIECWGASGTLPSSEGYFAVIISYGNGGYTSGSINLLKNVNLYLYVGESKIAFLNDTGCYNQYTSSFNGGGIGEASGGGATDVRLVDGEWNNFESQKSRIMVAGGGGGGFYIPTTSNRVPGHAGGLSGISANCIYDNPTAPENPSSGYSGEGGQQTRGGKHGSNDTSTLPSYSLAHADGSFGCGGYGYISDPSSPLGRKGSSSGGGGGYYGGGHGVHPGNSWTGGGGGSSFISGYSGCNAISSSSTEGNIIHTGQPNHYSGKVFSNSTMIDGGSVMPSPSGGTETGHTGDGYCIITWQQLP